MAANGRGNMRPAGRSPPFLAIGLFVALIILGFNYWSLSARNGEQSNEIVLMESELRLVNAKKTSAEKRSEAISDKVSDLERQLNQQKEIIANNAAELANVEKQKETFTNRVNELEIEVQGVRDQQLPSCEAEKANVERENRELTAMIETYKNKACTESDCTNFIRLSRDTTLEDVYKAAGSEPLISMYKRNNDLGSYRGQIAGLAAKMDQAAAQGNAHAQQQQADSQQQQQQAGLQLQQHDGQQQQPDMQQQQQQQDMQQQQQQQDMQQQQQPDMQQQQPDMQQQQQPDMQQQQPYMQQQQPYMQQQQPDQQQQQLQEQTYLHQQQSDTLQQQQQPDAQQQLDFQQQQQPLVPGAQVDNAPGEADTQNVADATNQNVNTNLDNADEDATPVDADNAADQVDTDGGNDDANEANDANDTALKAYDDDDDDDDDDEEDDAVAQDDKDDDDNNPLKRPELSKNENGINEMFQRDREVQDTAHL